MKRKRKPIPAPMQFNLSDKTPPQVIIHAQQTILQNCHIEKLVTTTPPKTKK